MSPTPDNNRDNPKHNEEEQEISMPDAPQFIIHDSGNSEEDEDDSHMDLANGGYQVLAQEPGTLSSDDEDEDSDGAEVHVGQAAAHIPDAEPFAAKFEQPAVTVPHIDPPELVERQEVWKAPVASNSTPMDQEKAEQIKNVMKNIKLPQMNIPSWARLVPEDDWKSQLVEKAKHKDNPSSK